MILGRITGTVTSTHALAALKGFRIMIVQAIDTDGRNSGKTLLALDTVQSGIGDKVLVIDEGNSARMILGDAMAPIRSLVVAIVDEVNVMKTMERGDGDDSVR